MDPKPVNVAIRRDIEVDGRLYNGLQTTGIALSEDRVQVEYVFGDALKLRDIIEIDGEQREVAGLKSDLRPDVPGASFVIGETGEGCVIVRHRAPPRE